jgi:hypothetical protein
MISTIKKAFNRKKSLYPVYSTSPTFLIKKFIFMRLSKTKFSFCLGHPTHILNYNNTILRESQVLLMVRENFDFRSSRFQHDFDYVEDQP